MWSEDGVNVIYSGRVEKYYDESGKEILCNGLASKRRKQKTKKNVYTLAYWQTDYR